MTRPSSQPTNAELEILSVLWDRGPSTVRQVQEALADDPPRGYTTVLKLMQIMADKGLVHRDESGRAHVYEAAISQEATRRRLIDDLAARAFGGSALTLALQALSRTPATEEEIEQIRALLAAVDEGSGSRSAEGPGPTSADGSGST